MSKPGDTLGISSFRVAPWRKSGMAEPRSLFTPSERDLSGSLCLNSIARKGAPPSGQQDCGWCVMPEMPPEDPTPEMLDRGAAVLMQNATGDPQTIVHDVWQAMMDEWLWSQSAEAADG